MSALKTLLGKQHGDGDKKEEPPSEGLENVSTGNSAAARMQQLKVVSPMSKIFLPLKLSAVTEKDEG